MKAEMKYQNEIVEIVQRELQINGSSNNIEIEMDLVDVGMDSLTFVQIIVEIEKKFHIEFPINKMNPESAGSIQRLCEIVMNTING